MALYLEHLRVTIQNCVGSQTMKLFRDRECVLLQSHIVFTICIHFWIVATSTNDILVQLLQSKLRCNKFSSTWKRSYVRCSFRSACFQRNLLLAISHCPPKKLLHYWAYSEIELAHWLTLNLDKLIGKKPDSRFNSYRKPEVLSVPESVFRVLQQFLIVRTLTKQERRGKIY